MNKSIKIKVIKKGDVCTLEPPAVTEKNPEQNNVSKMTSTISVWIDELRQRRREEIEAFMR